METIKTIAIESYVAEVSRLAKTGRATEHTFRGALAALIDALAPGLKAVNEPKRTDCGAPDYIVQDKTTQYFDDVPVEAWEQPIGGYRPAEKWLKDRKGRVLTQDDLKHYQRIILALAKTREIMNGLTTS